MRELDHQSSYIWDRLDERILLGALVVILFVGFFLDKIVASTAVIWTTRIVLLIVSLAIVFFLWPQEEEKPPEDDTEEIDPAEDILRLTEAQENIENLIGGEPQDFYQSLNQFFGNLMQMIKATFVAHSAILFMRDQESDRLRIEFCLSQSPAIRRGDLVEVDGTLPGSVLQNGKPVFEQNIPETGQGTRYYREPVEIRSFLAVPVSVEGNVRGVLAVDSKVAHDFSSDDLALLQAYEQLISQGIELLSDRERNRLIQQSFRAQKVLLAKLNEGLSLDQVFQALADACRSIYQFDRLTIATIDPDDSERGKIQKVVGQRNDMGEGFTFPLQDGLTGWVIRKNNPLLLSDFEKGNLFRPRYSANDKSNYGLRSFLGVPISFRSQVFGMISLESKQIDYFSEWDEQVLLLLAATAGLAFMALRLTPGDV